jgi:hypothetical protein
MTFDKRWAELAVKNPAILKSENIRISAKQLKKMAEAFYLSGSKDSHSAALSSLFGAFRR